MSESRPKILWGPLFSTVCSSWLRVHFSDTLYNQITLWGIRSVGMFCKAILICSIGCWADVAATQWCRFLSQEVREISCIFVALPTQVRPRPPESVLCSPIGYRNFQKKTKQNLMTEQKPKSVQLDEMCMSPITKEGHPVYTKLQYWAARRTQGESLSAFWAEGEREWEERRKYPFEKYPPERKLIPRSYCMLLQQCYAVIRTGCHKFPWCSFF